MLRFRGVAAKLILSLMHLGENRPVPFFADALGNMEIIISVSTIA